MQSHLYFTGNSFMNFDGSMDTTASMPAFIMTSKNDDGTLTFGGIDLNLKVQDGLNQINQNSFNIINLNALLNKTQLTGKDYSFDFDGIDLNLNANNLTDLLTFNQQLKILPFKFSRTLNSSNTPSVMDYAGIDFTHSRILNTDNVTFDESITIESKPFSSHKSINDNGLFEGYTHTQIKISDVKIDLTATQLSKAFYDLYTPFIEKEQEEIRTFLFDGYVGYREAANQAETVKEILAIFRALSGKVALQITPFDVNVIDSYINNETSTTTTTNNQTHVDAIRWDITPQLMENDKLLNSNFTLEGFKFISDKGGNLQTEFDIKSVNLAYLLSLTRLSHMTLDNKIESLTFNQTHRPNIDFNNLKLIHTIQTIDDGTLSYDTIYAIDKLNLMGASLGGFDTQMRLDNLNPEGLLVIEQSLTTALNNYGKKYQDFLQTLEAPSLKTELSNALSDNYVNIITTLYSKGGTLRLSPVILTSSAGKANMNLALEMRPLMPELLDSTQKPSDLVNSLLAKLNFNMSSDIDYISDIVAKFKLINEAMDNFSNENIDPTHIDVQKVQLKNTITQLTDMAPINLFIKREDNRLKTDITFSDNQLKINGTNQSLVEVLPSIMP